MIPSRPLQLSEILRETFSIFGRTFWKSFVSVTLLTILAVVLMVWSWTSFVEGLAETAKLSSVSSSSLTVQRDRALARYERQNPGSLERLRNLLSEAHVLDNTSAATPDSLQHAIADSTLIPFSAQPPFQFSGKFIGSFFLFFAFAVIAFLSICGAIAATTDIAIREFEERPSVLTRVLPITLRHNLWRVAGVQLMLIVGLGFLPMVVRLPALAAGPVIAGFVSLATTIATIYFSLRFFCTIPAVISEELSIFDGFRRSWELTRNSTLRILGVSITFGLICLLLLCGIGFLLLLVMATPLFSFVGYLFFSPTISLGTLAAEATHLLQLGIALFYLPWVCGTALQHMFPTVFYYDLRTRLDGPLTYSVGQDAPSPLFPFDRRD